MSTSAGPPKIVPTSAGPPVFSRPPSISGTPRPSTPTVDTIADTHVGTPVDAPVNNPIDTPVDTAVDAAAPEAHLPKATPKTTTTSQHASTVRLLEYILSPTEYAALRKKALSKLGPVSRLTPTKAQFDAFSTQDDEVPSAFRMATRALMAGAAGLKGIEMLGEKLAERRHKASGTVAPVVKKPAFHRSANFLFPLSISAILLLHRLLYRFFATLRLNMISASADEFRAKYPKVSKLLTSSLAPALGASLAGFALAIGPADERRVTITIYVLARAAEFMYNRWEDLGYLVNKPWWFGSWLLFPLSSAQLLHSFVFDRDVFPAAYGNAIMNFSNTYVQTRPENYPSHLPWPTRDQVLDNIGTIAQLKYPSFKSPILFPTTSSLPISLTSAAPIVAPAHPAITHLSCALLHPADPSCVSTFRTHVLREFPRVAKIIGIIYAVTSLPKYRALFKNPVAFISRVVKAVFTSSSFITLSIGISWASICGLQRLLPGNVLPTQRFYLSGFLGGLAAFIDRETSGGYFLYSARLGVQTWWKALVKHKRVKPIRGGDVLLFVFALAVINSVLEKSPEAISGGVLRKALNSLRGQGWKDPVQKKSDELKREVNEELKRRDSVNLNEKVEFGTVNDSGVPDGGVTSERISGSDYGTGSIIMINKE